MQQTRIPFHRRTGELSLHQDVVQVIFARGELRKEHIKELWQLDESQYEVLKQSLLKEKLLEPLRGTLWLSRPDCPALLASRGGPPASRGN